MGIPYGFRISASVLLSSQPPQTSPSLEHTGLLPWGLSGPVPGAVSLRSVVLAVSDPHSTFRLKDAEQGACKGLGCSQRS